MIAAALLLSAASVPAFAATIVGSKHDFSANNVLTTPFAGVWEVPGPGGFPLVIDQVCVFCHTPHGASKNVPGITGSPWLWNRTNSPPAGGYSYSMYSSSTLSVQNQSTTAPTGISMMCMSCHDGVTSIAVGTLLNPPGSATSSQVTANGIDNPGAIGNVYNGSMFLGWGPNLGEIYPGQAGNTTINLSNDHPISFDWPTGMAGKLQAAPTNSALRLFGASGTRMECATCHSVHDPTNAPFLAMSNANSAMCLACHIK
jgi:predicted CXXCH cytochrome family protein